MLTAEDFRTLALSLPRTVEAPHHGFPSFRVTGRIFATLPDPGHAHVMATEAAIRAAAQMHPACCSEYWWGKRLACVRIALAAAPAALVGELLDDAWNKKATSGQSSPSTDDAARSTSEPNGESPRVSL